MAFHKTRLKTSPWKLSATTGRKLATRRRLLLLANSMAKKISRLKAKRIDRSSSTIVVVQKRNLILDFPAEIRNLIYTFAVVVPTDLTSLVTPELSQVSRQLREEVLPIYYRKNSFDLCLSPPEGPGDSDAPAQYYYKSFKPLCKSLVPFISHITALRVVLVDKADLELGFLFRPTIMTSYWGWGSKIGHGYTNWTDRIAVMKAFRAVMRSDGEVYPYEGARKYLNIFVLVSALRFFKKHCAAAHDTRLVCHDL
ncbi:hypothetical protein F4680DRAFT_452677 [Xylaria scruposa]|nr:hypothetical protein F4680DRAFT_452677 [Xylaria scruposa]